MKNNDFTLFDYDEKKESSGLLRVAKINFESEEYLTWEDLFSGFDHLCAITFSSGINFVCKLLNKFENAETFASFIADNVPTGSNVRGSADYRKHLIRVLTERAVTELGGI